MLHLPIPLFHVEAAVGRVGSLIAPSQDFVQDPVLLDALRDIAPSVGSHLFRPGCDALVFSLWT